MPEMVSDEYREGYAAFYNDVLENPYYMDIDKYDSWEGGWLAAYMDWADLIGVS